MSGPALPDDAEIAATDPLADEVSLRRARERDLIEMRLRAEAAEAQLANVRQTLSFGLGQALVEALTWKGLVRLPGRIWELRHRQRLKRARVPGQSAERRPNDATRLIAPAIARAEAEGMAAAERWITAQTAPRAVRARALAEAALARLGAEPAAALAAGMAAARLHPGESRLAELAVRGHEAGAIAAPASLVAMLDPGLRDGAFVAPIRRLIVDGHRQQAGWDMPPRSASSGPKRMIVVAPMKPSARDRFSLAADRAAAAMPGAAFLDLSGGEPDDDTTRDGLAARIAAARASALHLVLDGIAPAFKAVAAARDAGMTVTVELVAPPAVLLPGAEASERGSWERAGLAVLLAVAERVIVPAEAFLGPLLALAPAAEIAIVPAAAASAPIPLDPAETAAIRAELDLPAGAIAIGCPVPLTDDPGLFALLAAVTALPDNVFLLFLADGAAAPALAREAARAGVAHRLRFAGPGVAGEIEARLLLPDLLVWPRCDAASLAGDRDITLALAQAAQRPLLLSAEEARWSGVAPGPHRATGEQLALLVEAIEDSLQHPGAQHTQHLVIADNPR